MTDSILSLNVRGTRRIRLFFSAALAMGAFTSLAPYAVSNLDGSGAASISVVQAFAVAADATAVEIALDSDLADGGLYEVDVTSVPMADSSTVTASLQVTIGASLATLSNVEPAQNDVDLLLFKRDIAHDGNDFVEGPDGDLEDVTGRDNFKGALTRRMAGKRLTWDPTYGPNADAYVNAPSVLQLPLKGALLAQARLDPRTKTATCDVTPDASDPDAVHLELTVQPIDGSDPIEVGVPTA